MCSFATQIKDARGGACLKCRSAYTCFRGDGINMQIEHAKTLNNALVIMCPGHTHDLNNAVVEDQLYPYSQSLLVDRLALRRLPSCLMTGVSPKHIVIHV
jgi:hypothetical protein